MKNTYAHTAARYRYYSFLKDSQPVRPDSLIGYATTDFYAGLPEGLLGDFVTKAIKAASGKSTEQAIDLAVLLSQSIKGFLPKGEIYVKTIYRLLPFDDSLFIYTVSGEEIERLCHAMAAVGGMPCSGAGFKIASMRAVDILIDGQKINKQQNYLVATTRYTLQKMKMTVQNRPVYAGINIQNAVIAYVSGMTKSGKAIYMVRQNRVLYKN